jgi:thiamine kinase-like enzyme
MIVDSDVPFSLEEIDATWLTKALKTGGVIEDEEVTGFTHRVIGQETGFLGEVAILNLTYSRPDTSAPSSMILKIPTPLKNRRMGQSMGVYEKEIRFYSHLGPSLKVRSPKHYYGALDKFDDPDVVLTRLERLHRSPIWLVAIFSLLLMWFVGFRPRRYVLLIEDVSHLRLGDQVGGCSPEDMKRALAAMAKLHAQFWDTDELRAMTWVQPGHLTSKLIHMMYLQSVEKFIEANSERMTERQTELLTWLKANGMTLTEILGSEPRTLLHGDFRLDNLCFDDEAGEVILLDWQTMLTGSVGQDLAYFLSATVPMDTPEEDIQDLLHHYRQCLADEGIEVSDDWLRWQYEAGMVATLYRIAPTANDANLDFGEARGPELINTWIVKILNKLEGIEFEQLINGPPAVKALG